jgi:acyl-CoA synthetase (AMP-forming)/AMP-acid ligase II
MNHPDARRRDLTLENAEQATNIVELLRYRAQYQPDRIAYRFLENGEIEVKRFTYQELHDRAQRIATCLQNLKAMGQRALLLYPPGLEFIAAFFGCLYAGVVAVPVYPPRRNQSIQRLQAIAADAQPRVALTTASVLSNLSSPLSAYPNLASLHWLATDHLASIPSLDWQPPLYAPDHLAFLQYTSGSTGTPKGVMVSHGNLLHNLRLIYQGFGHSANSRGAIWLPLYHDMGLIGGVLQPLYGGFPVSLMSPVDFLQRPLRWLQAISQTRATTSGGPNFAYELCTRKITPEQKATLDLSSWEVAFTGAEPVRAETLNRFAEAFAPCGFRWQAFYPCYGMAEATLFISGALKSQPPHLLVVEEKALSENHAVKAIAGTSGTRILVGVGKSSLDQQVRIVDPESCQQCSAGQVGEIWVAGASVAQGYWQQPDKSAETFAAYLTETGEGPFLRTGDLGFVQEDGELFVTGRLKDAIVIRGCNHYPQDIELTVEQSHSALVSNRSAAFSLDIDGEERLIVVAEIERRYRDRRQSSKNDEPTRERRQSSDRRQELIDPGFEVQLSEPPILEDVVSSIRQSVAVAHGLHVYAIALLRVGSIPKTSSGKIQRYACRQGFLDGSLTVVYQSPASIASQDNLRQA